jgi:hypothetical protein
MIFEYSRSPDGHFGLVDDLARACSERGAEVHCRTCGARYRLLDRVNAMGHPVAKA